MKRWKGKEQPSSWWQASSWGPFLTVGRLSQCICSTVEGVDCRLWRSRLSRDLRREQLGFRSKTTESLEENYIDRFGFTLGSWFWAWIWSKHSKSLDRPLGFKWVDGRLRGEVSVDRGVYIYSEAIWLDCRLSRGRLSRPKEKFSKCWLDGRLSGHEACDSRGVDCRQVRRRLSRHREFLFFGFLIYFPKKRLITL